VRQQADHGVQVVIAPCLQAVEFLLRLVELLPRGVEFDLQRAHLLVARGIAAFEGAGRQDLADKEKDLMAV